MAHLSRRRFLTIAAAAASAGTLPLGNTAHAETTRHWLGTALGARASIRLDHPDAYNIIIAIRAELDRLEQIFSLYRASSELSRLNGSGKLLHPSFEMVELLSLCDSIHSATSGLFDPTIQPVWATYAENYASERIPETTAIEAALKQTGWSKVSFSPERITLHEAGMALTFNGIAQGFIADKIARLLREKGLGNILVDTGEFYALGPMPNGKEWPVELKSEQSSAPYRKVSLSDAALASSASLGTAFDPAGRVGHIIDPRSGRTAPSNFPLITVRAPTAARADAFSTAMCLMTAEEIDKLAASQSDIRVYF